MTFAYFDHSINGYQAAQLTPIVKSCRRIQHHLLKNTDPALYNHLESLGIEPQLYGMQVFAVFLELGIENGINTFTKRNIKTKKTNVSLFSKM